MEGEKGRCLGDFRDAAKGLEGAGGAGRVARVVHGEGLRPGQEPGDGAVARDESHSPAPVKKTTGFLFANCYVGFHTSGGQ